MKLEHPCTYVSDDVQVCIVKKGEEVNADVCWTVEKCLDPEKRQLNKFVPEKAANKIDTANAGAIALTSIAGLVSLAGFLPSLNKQTLTNHRLIFFVHVIH